MSLTKPIPLPFNPDWKLNYHRIDQLAYNRSERALEIVIGSYTDAAAALAGAQPVALLPVIRVQGDDAEIALAALHDAAGETAYSFLKVLCEPLADATNA